MCEPIANIGSPFGCFVAAAAHFPSSIWLWCVDHQFGNWSSVPSQWRKLYHVYLSSQKSEEARWWWNSLWIPWSGRYTLLAFQVVHAQHKKLPFGTQLRAFIYHWFAMALFLDCVALLCLLFFVMLRMWLPKCYARASSVLRDGAVLQVGEQKRLHWSKTYLYITFILCCSKSNLLVQLWSLLLPTGLGFFISFIEFLQW